MLIKVYMKKQTFLALPVLGAVPQVSDFAEVQVQPLQHRGRGL